MRRTLVGLAIASALLGLAGCKSAYRSTKELAVHSQDIVYLKDDRTDLCFAVLAIQNAPGTAIRDLTMAPVPCANLRGVKTQ